MAATVLTDMLVTVNGADLSGQSNKMEITGSVDELDATTFASQGFKEVVGGLKSHEFTIEGLWAAGDNAQPDDRLWTDLGASAAWTAAVSQSTGSVAYFGNVLSGMHKVGGDIGTVAPFSAKGVGNGRAIRGELLHPASTARTTTGSTTGVQLGDLDAAESMFCALQVCSVAGTTPTLVVKLQSAATQGGSYTDRITFSSANSVSSQLSSVAGAVTDTWWRVNYTIAGTEPSFLFAVAAGIVTT
jgi:hypothetical protein